MLLGNDDLTVLVEATAWAHMVRELGGTATRALGTGRSSELGGSRATSVGGAAARRMLWYCHRMTSLVLARPPSRQAVLPNARKHALYHKIHPRNSMHTIYSRTAAQKAAQKKLPRQTNWRHGTHYSRLRSRKAANGLFARRSSSASRASCSACPQSTRLRFSPHTGHSPAQSSLQSTT